MIEKLYNKWAIIVALIVLVFLYYKYTGGTKKTKPGKKSGKKSKAKNDQEDEEEDDQIKRDSEELYNLVHEGMSEGTMALGEFRDLAGDIGDTSVYVELKQLYNQARMNNQNPNQVVTSDQYAKLLNSLK